MAQPKVCVTGGLGWVPPGKGSLGGLPREVAVTRSLLWFKERLRNALRCRVWFSGGPLHS